LVESVARELDQTLHHPGSIHSADWPTSPISTSATLLLTRIATCMRTNSPYILRDTDAITPHCNPGPRHRHTALPARTATTTDTDGSTDAESKRRTESRRSRWALQHPGPSTPSRRPSRLTPL